MPSKGERKDQSFGAHTNDCLELPEGGRGNPVGFGGSMALPTP